VGTDDRRRADTPAPVVDPGAADERAKDVLGQQPTRDTPGERLCRRIGARRFERAPIVSCTGKIFARYELADPWEPDSADRPLSLGPVAMRFEERRQPAPHAKVKQAKKKSEAPAWTPPKGIPDARTATPKPTPRPAPRPAAPAGAVKPPVQQGPVTEPLPLPPVAPPPRGVEASKKASSGRFRMRPTSTSGPRVRSVQRSVEANTAEESPAPPSSPEPPPRQPQSLDDLFGSMGGGRDKRVGRKKD
jgi:hypothetical protein